MPRAGGSRGNRPTRVFNGVYIDGLDEYRRDLRALGKTVPRLLGQIHHDIAEIGANRARQRAQSLGSTAAHVAPSIRSGYASAYAYVAIGSESYPMAMGAEFGSKYNIPRRTSRGLVSGWNQFEPWVGNQYETGASDQGGYIVGPAMRAAEPEMLTQYMRLLTELQRQVFYE